jgi:hypothetical protein
MLCFEKVVKTGEKAQISLKIRRGAVVKLRRKVKI